MREVEVEMREAEVREVRHNLHRAVTPPFFTLSSRMTSAPVISKSFPDLPPSIRFLPESMIRSRDVIRITMRLEGRNNAAYNHPGH